MFLKKTKGGHIIFMMIGAGTALLSFLFLNLSPSVAEDTSKKEIISGTAKQVSDFSRTPFLASEIQSPRAFFEDARAESSWKYFDEQPLDSPHFVFDVLMQINEPATAYEPVEQGVRFVTYNNQENIGGYEAGLVMKNSTNNDMYRVMFSSLWKEIVVWSSKGGIIAVKPYPFKIATPYQVFFGIHDNRLVVAVNKKIIIDLLDETASIQVDVFGLATNEGKTVFGPVHTHEFNELVARHSSALHEPHFSLRVWKNILWGFDGDEPIFALPSNKALATEVKLVPGYRAQLALPWYMQNWVDEPFRTDVVVTTTLEEEGEHLKFSLLTKDTQFRKDLLNKTTVTVTYDPGKNVYQYDHQSELIIPSGATLRMTNPIDVTDPAFYQIVPSGSTQGKQWPVSHTWSVYQQLNGQYYKEPLNHFSWYPGYGTPEWWNANMNYMKPNQGTWAVVGDEIANPVFEWEEREDRKEFSALMCWWAYDLHWNWMPGDGSPQELGAGTYSVNWRLSSLPKNDADLVLSSSTFAFPKDLTARWLVYTGGVGNVEKFDKTVLKASPFGEFVWGEGSFQETTFGKDSSTSLKLSGPVFVQTLAGDSEFTEPFEEQTAYEISAWVKTQDVQGEGPGIVFSGQPYYPGVTGTQEWQRIGFVAKPKDPLHTVDFSLHLSGSGNAWFDNFLIRPITSSTPAHPELANSPKPLTSVGPVDSERYVDWRVSGVASDTVKTLMDFSGHGNHAVLQNVNTRVVNGEAVFHFSGDNSQILMRGHDSVSMPSPASLVLWVKPGEGFGGWNVLASGGPELLDRWRVLLVKSDAYYVYAHVPGGVIGNGTVSVEKDKWSQLVLVDDGTNTSLYLNSVLVGKKSSTQPLFASGAKGYIRIGAMSYGGAIYSPYQGEVSSVKIFSKALTSAEIKTEFSKGAFAP